MPGNLNNRRLEYRAAYAVQSLVSTREIDQFLTDQALPDRITGLEGRAGLRIYYAGTGMRQRQR
jgi:hypothetical protein